MCVPTYLFEVFVDESVGCEDKAMEKVDIEEHVEVETCHEDCRPVHQVKPEQINHVMIALIRPFC